MTLLIILLAVALQVFLTYKKISPFLSLLLVAILAGLALGVQPRLLLQSVEKGVSSTLGGVMLIICLGAILGKILENSGAIERITTSLIKLSGEKNVQWAILLTGFLVGIPLFYSAGFIILVPLVFSIARKTGRSLLYLALPMAASLSTTHCFLPPHPGPVLLVNAFKADMGKTLIYGMVIAIPIVILAGPVLGRLLPAVQLAEGKGNSTHPAAAEHALPSGLSSFLIALLPVMLISAGVVVTQFFPGENLLANILVFTGDASIALLIAVVAAVYFFGIRRQRSMDTVMKWLNESLAGIAPILLIITAGGIFKQVLVDSGTGTYIASFSSKWQLPPLLFAWVITALLRVVIGSATVAAITAAGVVGPLIIQAGASPELMVLAVGTGSVFGSHINDSGFWLFKEFFQLSLKRTFLSWSLMESLISVLGILGVLLLNSFIG
jgi:Gnt-I system high-affinity gluconate transporter